MLKKLAATLVALAVPVMLAAPALASDDQPVHKSYVCKYVGTPGVDERLQTGQNPIWVDNHSLGDHSADLTYVGEEFADAQGRSIVIVANTDKLDPEPTVADCPPAQPGEVSAGVTFTDPTCDEPNAAAVETDDVTGVSYEVSGKVAPGETVTVTATADEGYVLVGQSEFTHTFASLDDCPKPGKPGGAITLVGPNCPSNRAAVTLENTGDVDLFYAFAMSGKAGGEESGTLAAGDSRTFRFVVVGTVRVTASLTADGVDVTKALDVRVRADDCSKPTPPPSPNPGGHKPPRELAMTGFSKGTLGIVAALLALLGSALLWIGRKPKVA